MRNRHPRIRPPAETQDGSLQSAQRFHNRQNQRPKKQRLKRNLRILNRRKKPKRSRDRNQSPTEPHRTALSATARPGRRDRSRRKLRSQSKNPPKLKLPKVERARPKSRKQINQKPRNPERPGRKSNRNPRRLKRSQAKPSQTLPLKN